MKNMITIFFLFFIVSLNAQMFYSNEYGISRYDIGKDTSESIFNSGLEGIYIGQFCIDFKNEIIFGASIPLVNTDGSLCNKLQFSYSVSSSQTESMFFVPKDTSIYANRSTVIEKHTGEFNSEYIVKDLINVHGMAADLINNTFYFSDRGDNRIYRVNLDGTEKTEIIYLPSGLADPRGIDLDLINKKIYWVNTGQRKIQRANLDGSEIEDWITGLEKPENIAIDIDNNLIIWTDISLNVILKSDANGENIDTLVSENIFNPKGIVIDKKNRVLYWSNQGKGYNNGVIEKMNLDNKDRKGLLVGYDYFEEGFSFSIDELQEYVFLNTPGFVSKSKLDGSYNEILLRKERSYNTEKSSLAIDVLTNQIFYTRFDYDSFFIDRISYSGLNDTTIIALDSVFLLGEQSAKLFIDGLNQELYWLIEGEIFKSKTDGSEYELFYSDDLPITDFGLDFINTSIYYTVKDFVKKANFDGSDSQPIIGGKINDIVVAPIKERLYYPKQHGMFYSDLDGSYETAFCNITRINDFTFGSTDGYAVIPLTQAQAISKEDNIELEWEIDNSIFEEIVSDNSGNINIEKRKNGKWENIGNVYFNNNKESYNFTDNNPIANKNEYRLNYVSTNSGLSSYSKNFSVEFSTGIKEVLKNDFVVYYNYHNDKLTVSGVYGKTFIYDLNGKLILEAILTNENNSLTLNNLKSGIYCITVNDNLKISSKLFYIK